MIMQSRATQGQANDLEKNDLIIKDKATLLTPPIDAVDPSSQDSVQEGSENGVEDLRSHISDFVARGMMTIGMTGDHIPVATIEPQSAGPSIGPQQMVQDPVACDSNHDIGPITKLAMRDPSLIANLVKAGFTEPFPVTAASEAELVQKLEDWMIDQSDTNPPGAIPANVQRLAEDKIYAIKITLATTTEEVFTRLCRVTRSLMVYIVQDADGSCMLAKPEVKNSSLRRGYYGWLGGNLGFTARTIANSDGFQPSGALSSPRAKGGSRSSSKHGCRAKYLDSPVINFGADTQFKSTTKLIVKIEPTITEVRQATLRRDRTERQTDEQRWRFETPPLSSMDTVKKRRWPPKYVSPPPTPQPKRSDKRRNIGGMLDNRVTSRSSSPELLCAGPLTPPQGNRRSARVNYKIPSPPKTPKKTKKIAKKSPIITKPTTTTYQPSVLEPLTTKDVVLHFFLSNDSLGAVPVTLNECNTATKFFNQALSAWNLLGGGDQAGSMAAVSVMIDGFHWPTVLPWGNAAAFKRMMETIAIARIGKMGNFEIRIKCLKT